VAEGSAMRGSTTTTHPARIDLGRQSIRCAATMSIPLAITQRVTRQQATHLPTTRLQLQPSGLRTDSDQIMEYADMPEKLPVMTSRYGRPPLSRTQIQDRTTRPAWTATTTASPTRPARAYHPLPHTPGH